MTIETDFYTDPMCIWALVAEPKLARLEATFGDKLQVRHRVLPLFGSIDERFATGSWAASGIAGRVAATARVAKAQGIDGVSGAGWEHAPASSWGPSAVVAAVAHLVRGGVLPSESTQRAMYGLRHAFFFDDKDITRRAVQEEVLESLELPVAQVLALVDEGPAWARLSEARDARDALRLDGSPTWIFDGGRAKLFGNVDDRVLHATVQALLDGEEAGCSVC